MTRIPLLLTACLLAACSSDDAKFRAADYRFVCDGDGAAFVVTPSIGDLSEVARAKSMDGECAKRLTPQERDDLEHIRALIRSAQFAPLIMGDPPGYGKEMLCRRGHNAFLCSKGGEWSEHEIEPGDAASATCTMYGQPHDCGITMAEVAEYVGCVGDLTGWAQRSPRCTRALEQAAKAKDDPLYFTTTESSNATRDVGVEPPR